MSDNVTHAVAGALGGMFGMTVTYPLTTVATRQQVHRDKEGYKNTLEAYTRIIKEEGIMGLFSGIDSALWGIALTQFVYYYWYEFIKSFFQGPSKKPLSATQGLLAGTIAGMFTSVITNPIWVVNTRMTATKKTQGAAASPTMLQTFQLIIKEGGVGALWKGIGPALILCINPGIQYMVSEQLKQRWENQRGGAKLGDADFFYIGAISKLIATGITYPYLTVKSRMQMGQKYKSSGEAVSRILKEEGVAGFYNGIQSKIVQSVLNSAMLFSSKERFYQLAVFLLVLLKLRAAAPVPAK